ncbi:MAG: tellurite resistance TerB family protein [Pseudomonadales bacterium]|nr:tellurite resistance TerB family protein [Pseudomonadales bacterium]
MNFSKLLNDLAGTVSGQTNGAPSATNSVRSISDKIPGGLAGGAVAGGLVAMLVGSKSARKTAGKAATYGGAAVLGGLAYKAYKGWQQNEAQVANTQQVNYQAAGGPVYIPDHNPQPQSHSFEQEALEHMNGAQPEKSYQIVLIKAMIASARADGHIDGDEQNRISDAIGRMNLDHQTRGDLLDLFLQPIQLHDVINSLESMEQKAEVYLASCLAIDLDHQAEYAHLSRLAKALELPPGLEQQLRAQAKSALSEVA